MLDDIKKLVRHIEKKLGYRCYSVAIHRDEGHLNSEGEWVTNYHAHVCFLTLNADGINMQRRTNPRILQELQTKTAEILQMERGEFNSKTLRLEHREFKAVCNANGGFSPREVKAKIKELEAELKAANAEARNELKEQGAERKDYSALEQENNALKTKIKELKETSTEGLESDFGAIVAVIRARVDKIRENPRVKEFAKQKIQTFKSCGIFDRQKILEYAEKARCFEVAVRQKFNEWLPVVKNAEATKKELENLKTESPKKLMRAFMGSVAAKADTTELQAENDGLKADTASLIRQKRGLRVSSSIKKKP